jgi:hypothetical protein
MSKHFVIATCLLFAALIIPACVVTQTAAEKPAVDVSGHWEGATRVTPCVSFDRGRCNAYNPITFDWRMTPDGLRGDYHCAVGNMVCRDADRTKYGSVVSGRVSGSNINFRLMLPGDLSSCLFYGTVTEEQAAGTYNCYQGGALVEFGAWQVKRGRPG